MNIDKFKIFCIYSENEEGTLDELVVDTYNEDYAFTRNTDEEELACRHDPEIKGFRVSRDFFDYYYNLLNNLYSGSFRVRDDDYAARKKAAEETERKKRARPLIDGETVRKALRLELPEEELSKVSSFDYRLPKGDYYDFDLFLGKIHDVMAGRLEIPAFTQWCIIVMRCLEDHMKTNSRKLKRLFYELGDYFDGMAFMSSSSSEEEKRKECLESIAWLKYYNHLILDAKSRRNTPFTTNGVITYIDFAFSLNDGCECMMKTCVVDLDEGKINYMYIPEIEYDERINYTFLPCSEFDDLSSEYFEGFSLDTSMTVDYALRKGEEV